MRKPLLAAIMLSGASALAVALTATPVTAASTATWTVTPGGAFQVTHPAAHSHLTDTTNGNTFLCQGTVMNGTLKSGSGLANPIGKISFMGSPAIGHANLCGGPAQFNMTFSHFPINIRAVKYNSATGVTTGVLTGIHINLTTAAGAPPCAAIIDGTGLGADDGQIHFSFSNAGGGMHLSAQASLHAFNVFGCGGAISNGDALSLQANVGTLVPMSGGGSNTITSP